MIKPKWMACSGAVVLVLGGLVTLPQRAYAAQPWDVSSACAAGTTGAAAPAATVISDLYMELQGVISDAGALAFAAPTTTGPGTLTISTASSQSTGAMGSATGATTPGSTSASSVASEYGYFNYIRGLVPVFQPGTQNAQASLFTFVVNVAPSQTAATGSFLPTSTRTGTMTVYLGTGESAQFARPSSFSSGTAIMTATLTEQLLGATPLNRGYFGAVNPLMPNLLGVGPTFYSGTVGTVTSATPFSLGGTCYQLGAPGTTFDATSVGRLATPYGPNGSISGFITSGTYLMPNPLFPMIGSAITTSAGSTPTYPRTAPAVTGNAWAASTYGSFCGGGPAAKPLVGSSSQGTATAGICPFGP